MPNLSSIIDKFLRRAGLTSQEMSDLRGDISASSKREFKTSSFTAESHGRYHTSGNITVTNPVTGTVGDIFTVVIATGTAVVNGVTYSASRFQIEVVCAAANVWTTPGAFITGNLTADNLSGSNTGDQTNVTGNAATVTTIAGMVTAGSNVTISGAGTTASPFSVAATVTLAQASDIATVNLPTVNTPLAAILASKASITYGTAAPNTSTNVASISAGAASTTNADLVLSPKGIGAILAHTPDNTTVGGNKRGFRSIDLQTYRSVNTQVANGAEAVIVGGNNNTASGSQAAVVGGSGNTASGALSFTGGGQGNLVSGGWCAVPGGGSNTAGPANYAVVSGGVGNTASGLYSSVSGGISNIASGQSSAVTGGASNAASGAYSLAAGRRAKATLAGSTVISDSQDADVTSAIADGITFRFAGGYVFLGGGAVFAGSLTVGSNSWDGSIITGPQSFSSTTRPTSSGTGAPAATSLITAADGDSRYQSNVSVRDLFPNLSVTTSGMAGGVAQGSPFDGIVGGYFVTGSGNTTTIRINLCSRSLMGGFAEDRIIYSRPWSLHTRHLISLTSNTTQYMVLGGKGDLGIPSTNGAVGFEITDSTTVRIWAYATASGRTNSSNGTISGINTTASNPHITGEHYFWLDCNGAGTLTLFWAYRPFETAMPLKPASPICTLATGVPTTITSAVAYTDGGSYGYGLCQYFMRATGAPGALFVQSGIRAAKLTEY